MLLTKAAGCVVAYIIEFKSSIAQCGCSGKSGIILKEK